MVSYIKKFSKINYQDVGEVGGKNTSLGEMFCQLKEHLAQLEFAINNAIKVHPLALAKFDELEDEKVKKEIICYQLVFLFLKLL